MTIKRALFLSVQSFFTHKMKPQVTADDPRDYWPDIETMIAADIGSWSEMILRFSVVGLGAVFMTLATGQIEIMIWLFAFLAVNGYYSWHLSRLRAPVSRHQFTFLTILFAVSVTLYTSCAVYLFLIGTPAFITVALAALIAQALFNTSRHRENLYLMVYDTVVVTVAGLFFGLSSVTKAADNPFEQTFIIITTVGVCSYYVIAQIRKRQFHNALQASRQEAAQAQKMRAVEQLTTGVAHEFNNLLTVIRGNIELAQLYHGTDDYQDRLTDAIRATDRADTLTSQLLSLSHKARLCAVEIELDEFCQRFTKILPRITPANISIEVNTAPKTKIYCDRDQLEVALINLVINANDAIEGQGRIWLSCRSATQNDRAQLDIDDRRPFVVISVRDNGPGIPPHLLPKVVEPFFTTKGVGKGTGLGLPMVKGFCEQSGGGFGISSDETGTTVSCTLPTLRH